MGLAIVNDTPEKILQPYAYLILFASSSVPFHWIFVVGQVIPYDPSMNIYTAL